MQQDTAKSKTPQQRPSLKRRFQELRYGGREVRRDGQFTYGVWGRLRCPGCMCGYPSQRH